MERILIAMTAGDTPSLGNVWRITSKKSDFYIDPVGDAGTAVHMSLHGPNERFSDHRFHIKVDKKAVSKAKERGQFVEHGVPRNGFVLDGQEVAPGAFLVARLRWAWHLQRPRYRGAAVSGMSPELAASDSGARISEILPANSAWDIDIVVSYDEPHWPDPLGSLRDNARLGPLRNDAGLWLTATSYHRSQLKYPAPESVRLPLPSPGETPNRILAGGIGRPWHGGSDIYWFVETITSREHMETVLMRAT